MPFLATPLALLGLTLVPALVTIYLFRHRARRLEVSSLIFFPRASEASAGGRRLRRPTAPLLLLLELLAVALLVLAAARPAIEGALSARPLALVLDDSLSMRAGGGESPRERALAHLTRELSSTRHRPIVVVLAGLRPAALGQPARRGADALARLAGWRCLDAESRLAEGVALARELSGSRARTLVLTDRIPGAEVSLPPDVEVLALGTARSNLAIVDASRGERESGAGADSGDEAAQVQVASFAREARSAVVTLEELPAGAARVLASLRIDLGPMERKRLVLPLPVGAGVVRVRLSADAPSELIEDDSVLLAPAPARRVRADVRLSDASARELVERAILAAQGAPGVGSGPPSLVFVDRLDPREPPDPDTWRCAVRSGGAGLAGLAHAGPFVLDRESPLLSGLSLDGVIWGAPGERRPVAGRPIVLAGDTPLLSVEERADGGHDVDLAFVPALSTLQATPAFPALIANLLADRRAALPGPDRANVRAGEEVSVRVAAGVSRVVAVLPGGRRRELPVSARQAAMVAEDAGLLVVDSHPIAVNVVAASESDLLQAGSGQRGGLPPNEKVSRGARDVAWVLGLLALGVLALHRLAILRTPEAAA